MDITTTHLTKDDVVKEEPIKLFSPNTPTPPLETIFLSNIDQAVIFSVETLSFYELPPTKSTSTLGISDSVKKAVAEVLLVPYYFLAGRLDFNHEANRFELLCNNAGVLFVSATSRLTLKDLGNLSAPNYTFRHFIHRPGLYKSLAETALFTIQVTRFKCGGFALGFATNHGVLDGKSASDMFHNLASICRGDGLKAKVINNDRTLFRARNPPQIKYPHKEYVKLKKISSLASSFSSKNKTSPSPLIFLEKYAHKLFPFTPEMIKSLKEKAMIKSLKEKAMIKCSSFEAIVAHLWKARTKAVFENLDEFSTVLFAVDIRSRVSPPLPSAFTGNAVITAFATAKVSDVVEKPLCFCVEKVKEATERVTDEYVRSVIDWLEVYKGIPATCNGTFYVSAWWKLHFRDLDFGFGKPVHCGPVVSGNDEFVLLLSDGTDEGGINMWMGLEKEKMKKFMAHVFEI
ncbi:acyltransferase GLAUCE-like [Cornus florida]|uniref:acyltransferase GLAUCE-like n=1 Tax=Cornus florida TaxID=4283 RepID=UPI0028A25776|nr:acyltransferase GLAUCE-like [Cornus florida]